MFALHDFSGDIYCGNPIAEYKFAGRGHKWFCIKNNLPRINKEYQYYAFLDNDIEITTNQVNKLFEICDRNKLQLHQPTLTYQSCGSHLWLFKRYLSEEDVREVPFVELMMPFFHKDALLKCFNSFTETESGWGLDVLWAHLLEGKVTVSDSVTVTHAKPVESGQWVLKNGKTAQRELNEVLRRYYLGFPRYIKLGFNEKKVISLIHEMGGHIS